MIKVSGHLSSVGPVRSGVPQGSSLGPLLFLILITDIDTSMEYASVSSFADDTRILMKIEDSEDCSRMQEDLVSVYGWAVENKMKFNSKKFELMSYTAQQRDLNQINESTKLFNYPQYFDPDGCIISSVSNVRDLGVKISDNATFQLQINDCVCKATRYSGWILRVFKSRDTLTMTTLFKSMVLPHLEYCCPLWSPTTIGRIRQLEAIQRNFTAKINGLASMNYWERLKILGLYSLERRRERYIILYIFKIIQGITPNFQTEKFKIKVQHSPRRGRSCVIPSVNTRSLASVATKVEGSFAIRGPKLFNALPFDLRNYDGSAEAFKSRLDKFLAEVPDKPSLPAYHQPATNNSIIEQLAVLRAAGIQPY